jgi:D-beta-D-heptose 7-phosphate kinase/D-beta-D-heptose 1-phosphate adenosyltransferase
LKSLEKIDGSINILLEGCIFKNFTYLREGSIINSFDNVKFLEDKSLILTLNKIDFLEDSKIIYSNEQLKILVETLKNDNKKIILSSGCFDIIHIGHINNLMNARKLGDTLMVCLSNDEQIKILKGDDRPINNYEDRINLFKTIKYVDYIILYNEEEIETEETLGSIMKIVDPFIWVKGSDYSTESIYKKHPYLKNIKLINNVPDKSTTNIIKKIKDKK